MKLTFVAEWLDSENQKQSGTCSSENGMISQTDFSVPYSYKNGQLRIQVGSLVENQCKLMTLQVLNRDLAGLEGGGGATFIPHGCGALIRHCNHEETEQDMSVFYPCGSNADISLFGVLDENENGVAAAVLDGRFDMTLRMRLNWGEEKSYTAFPVFAIRDYEDEAPLDGDIVMEYFSFSGGWIKAAEKYRELMASENVIPTLKEKVRYNPVVERSSRSLCFRFRLGVRPVPEKCEDPDKPNQEPIKVYMTFEDIRKIADEFSKQDIMSAEFALVGWNLGGHDGAYPQLFPVEDVFGGEEELLKTMEYCAEKGYPVSLHDNYFDCYSIADCYDHDSVQIIHDGGDLLGGIWGAGQSRQMCAIESYKRYARRNMAEVYERLQPEGTYYIDVLSVAQLTKCYSKDHPMSREGNAKWWKKTLKVAQDTFGAVNSEGGRDWALPELDRSFSLVGNDSIPDYCDEEIPLVPVAWHGYLIYNTYRGAINESAQAKLFLKNLAYGGIPTIYFHQIFLKRLTKEEGWSMDVTYSRDPEILAKTVAEKIKPVSDAFAKLADLTCERITGFKYISETLSETIFENGTHLWVNYADIEQTIPDGATILPKNFVVHK